MVWSWGKAHLLRRSANGGRRRGLVGYAFRNVQQHQICHHFVRVHIRSHMGTTGDELSVRCALQLLEQGHIALDDHAEHWVPELRGKKILKGYSSDGRALYEMPTSKVTVRDLFCHTGG